MRPGEVLAVEVAGIGIVLLRGRDGRYRALRDNCPHQGARLSSGVLQPLVESDAAGDYRLSEGKDVLVCGWHGYAYDVDTGIAVVDGAKTRVRCYPAKVARGQVVVEI